MSFSLIQEWVLFTSILLGSDSSTRKQKKKNLKTNA